MRYALIKAGVVENIIELELEGEELEDFLGFMLLQYSHALPSQEAGIGWLFDEQTKTFSAPQVVLGPQVEIVVLQVTTSSPYSSIALPEITVPVGTHISVSVELQIAGALLPITQSFRMPLIARDGRERFLLAAFQEGKAVISSTFTESGCWRITQQAINAGLPPELQMDFAGLDIYVLQ